MATVVGLFDSRDAAQAAIEQLRSTGIEANKISVVMKSREEQQDLATDTGVAGGAVTGAVGGGVLGGLAGLLVGIGALAIPGVGPFIAAGPIVAALAGVGVGGALGGITGALVGMGIPEYEAKRYEGAVRNGGTLLSVHCDTSDQINLAKQGLRDTGAHDIASTGEESAARDRRHHAA